MRRPSPEQEEVVLEFMHGHPDLAAGRFRGADGIGTARRLWNELATVANAVGQNRTVVQWKKVGIIGLWKCGQLCIV